MVEVGDPIRVDTRTGSTKAIGVGRTQSCDRETVRAELDALLSTVGSPQNVAGAVAIAILFPICRSELLLTSGDPSELRLVLDRDVTSTGISSSLVRDLQNIYLPDGQLGSRLLLEIAAFVQDQSSPSALRSAIESMVSARMANDATGGQASNLGPSLILRRLRETFEEADSPDLNRSDILVQGALVGQQLEQAFFLADVDKAGLTARQAIELDCAWRMLPWFDRFDTREKRSGGVVLRTAMRSAWDIVSGRGDVSRAAKIDRALQREFVDTSRYGDSDWVAWSASRTADAVYAAVGHAF